MGFKVSFGHNGSDEVWYLQSGPSGFKPIDVARLPGPKPSFEPIVRQVAGSYTQESFTEQLIYGRRVLANTGADGTTTLDLLPDWNRVKNVQLVSDSAESFFLDGFVHVDAMLGVDDTAATTLVLNGTKRANVITGLGDDLVDIRMVSDQNSVWVDDYRISTGAGRDTVKLSGLDVNAEIQSGDLTFVQAYNKPGLPLTATGVGRTSYVATGADDDVIVGYTSNDHLIAGEDDGAVRQVMTKVAAEGVAYAVGGSIGRGCASILYKLDLKTGAATAVGEVKIPLGKWGAIGGLDIDSLALNPKDGQLYAFATKFGLLDALVRIDPATGGATYIKLNCAGFRSERQDMTFDSGGNLWFVSNGDLMKVTTAGAVTTVGNDTLDCRIAALASDPNTGKLYGLAEQGSRGTVMYEIDPATGKAVASWKVAGLDRCSDIEGMAFDGAGKLWAVDRVSGAVVTIDLATRSATAVSKTLTDAKMFGDGFEALTISQPTKSVLTDLQALGGDAITTGEGADHLYYALGDGVDRVLDFDKAVDTLHLVGFTADRLVIQEFGGDTFIRFKDDSADGFVDDAMIELQGVTGLDPALLRFDAPEWW